LQLKSHQCDLTTIGPLTQPRYSDNFRRVEISVFGVTTPATAEFGWGSAVAPFDMETPAAALGSIVRVDKHHCHTLGCCLVTDKLLQLVKRPTRKHSPLLFMNRYRAT
jgi:hypothetical protein